MKIKIFIVLLFLLFIGIFVWAKTSIKENFAQAKDFPNGALVYMQVTDLPQFIRLINESNLKENYLHSANFANFQKSHLGIKLTERFDDLSDAIGFPIDLNTLSSLAENKAALAIYDIGKLDIVFIAPMNETFFSATMFGQNSDNFTENTLKDGTKVYQIEVEVDRKRQQQKLIFANIKNRFILTTNEKLFLQTISAINGKQRLYDEKHFTYLTQKMQPNLATFWVNQDKLNSDYYFKRYWLMNNFEELQNIQAGIFDLNFNDTYLTEKREFLIKKSDDIRPISKNEAQDLITKIPKNTPFYQLTKIDNNLGKIIYKTLFDNQIIEKTSVNYEKNWRYINNANYFKSDYKYLNSDFDEDVQTVENEEIIETKPFDFNKILSALNSANPNIILTATSPKLLDNPMFVNFRKIAILSLQNPNNFQSKQFENAIIDALKNQVTVGDTNFIWETEKGWRKLKVPMLNREIIYQLINNKLFVSNSFEFFSECLLSENKIDIETKNFSDFAVINLENHEQNFEQIMQKLATENNDVFTTNISSLLNLAENVKQIEVRKKTESNSLSQEIKFVFTENAPDF